MNTTTHTLKSLAATNAAVTLRDGTTGTAQRLTEEEGVTVLVVAGTGAHEGETHYVTLDDIATHDENPVMFNRFELTIGLGNDAMQSGPDVADALRRIADKIENDLEARGSIRDLNGNTVGEYGPSND